MIHGSMIHGSMNHGSMIHGSMIHGSMIHGSMIHGCMIHGSMNHGYDGCEGYDGYDVYDGSIDPWDLGEPVVSPPIPPDLTLTSHTKIEVFLPCGSDERGLGCLLYTSPSPRDKRQSRMPSSA